MSTDRRTKAELLEDLARAQERTRIQTARWAETQTTLHEAMLAGGEDLEDAVTTIFGPPSYDVTVMIEARFYRTSVPGEREVREWLETAWDRDLPCGIPDGHEGLEIDITIHSDRQ